MEDSSQFDRLYEKRSFSTVNDLISDEQTEYSITHSASQPRLGSQLSVRVTDFDAVSTIGHETVGNSRLFEDSSSLSLALRAPLKPRSRIISIFSAGSLGPIYLNQSALSELRNVCNVPPSFLSILYSFPSPPRALDCRNSFFSLLEEDDDLKSVEYLFRYPQETSLKSGVPWRLRQMAVYHRYTKHRNLLILLEPTPDAESTVSKQMQQLVQQRGSQAMHVKDICDSPKLIHALIFSAHIHNWNPYIQHVLRDYETINSLTLGMQLDANCDGSFLNIQKLNDMRDKACLAKAFCQTDDEIIENLQILGESDAVKALASVHRQLSRAVETAVVAECRIQQTVQLLGSSIDLSTQTKLAVLAQRGDRSSKLVFIFSLISGIFIPGSFLATLYGMNFFVFDLKTNRLVIANNFYVFIITWIPLTFLVTLLFYLVGWPDKCSFMTSFGQYRRWTQVKNKMQSSPYSS